MDKFEQQFENLDVKSSDVEQAMSDVTTLTVPQVSYYFPLLIKISTKRLAKSSLWTADVFRLLFAG